MNGYGPDWYEREIAKEARKPKPKKKEKQKKKVRLITERELHLNMAAYTCTRNMARIIWFTSYRLSEINLGSPLFFVRCLSWLFAIHLLLVCVLHVFPVTSRFMCATPCTFTAISPRARWCWLHLSPIPDNTNHSPVYPSLFNHLSRSVSIGLFVCVGFDSLKFASFRCKGFTFANISPLYGSHVCSIVSVSMSSTVFNHSCRFSFIRL